MARRLSDPPTLAYVLTAAHWGVFAPGTAPEREPQAREMLTLAEASGDRRLEVAARGWLFTDLFELGDIERATDEGAREMALADELRLPEFRWGALVHQACLALFGGRIDEAEELADQALAVGQQAEVDSAMQMYGVAADGPSSSPGRNGRPHPSGRRHGRAVSTRPSVAVRLRLHLSRARTPR